MKSQTEIAAEMEALAHESAEKAQFERAIAFYERAVGIYLHEGDSAALQAASALNKLGECHYMREDMRAATHCMNHALRLRQAHLPEDHKDLAESWNNVGSLHAWYQDYESAQSCFALALRIWEAQAEDSQAELASGYNNMGTICKHLGQAEEALKWHQKGLAIDLRNLPKTDTRLATSYNNLAILLYEMGDLSAALPHWKTALSIFRASPTPQHPHLERTLSTVQWALDNAAGKLPEADIQAWRTALL